MRSARLRRTGEPTTNKARLSHRVQVLQGARAVCDRRRGARAGAVLAEARWRREAHGLEVRVLRLLPLRYQATTQGQAEVIDPSAPYAARRAAFLALVKVGDRWRHKESGVVYRVTGVYPSH